MSYQEKKKIFQHMLTIYGRKAVEEALLDSDLPCYKLHLADSNKPAAIIQHCEKMANKRGIAIEYHDKRKLSFISKNAIERVRLLFASAFDYSLQNLEQSFGMYIQAPEGLSTLTEQPYAVFLHSTVWSSKIWPTDYWIALAKHLIADGYSVFLPWGSDEEKKRAESIALASDSTVLNKLPLTHLAWHLQNASVVVGSDTGLTHVAGALSTPTIGIYGPTSTLLTGVHGVKVNNLSSSLSCSPCLKRECPLVTEGQLIPCYKSIDADLVSSAAKELVHA